MNCNVINDLLPSYIDGLCSEDTIKIVKEHLQECEECKSRLKMMQHKTDYVGKIPEEVKKAITPLKKINKKRRIQVITATVITFILTFIGALVFQEVNVVNQFFSPMVSAVVVVDSENKLEWESLHFNDEKYLIYDSIFWDKEIINHANSENNVQLRVKDEKGHIVVSELKISPGTSIILKSLKKNKKYFFEIKAEQGRYFINAT